MRFIITPRNRYIEVEGEGREGIITFPTWVPGSYFIRDQERNVIFYDYGYQISKNKFWINGKFKYTYYANSKDQREVISLSDYLFINPVSLFPFQDLNEKYCVKINVNWSIHTTLRREGEWYCGDNYDEFADSPIQASPHLKLIKIDEKHSISTIDDFKEVEKLKSVIHILDSYISDSLPNYIFFFRRSDKNLGGIEHKDSSAIVTTWDRKDLIWLFAHEYFHRWNIKRIKPKDLKINYEHESYTELLWVAEGLTDYIAFLSLIESGVLNATDALKVIANILQNLTFPGFKRMSIAESSKLTWIKLYKKDENYPNIGISYYDSGFILGLLMDFVIRENSECKKSIIDFFRELYKIREYTYADVKRVAESLRFENLDELVHKRNPPIFEYLGRYMKIIFTDKDKPYYGIRVENNVITFVEDNSPADLAGLNIGDEIIAIDGIKKQIEVNEEVILTISREGRLKEIKLRSGNNPGHKIRLFGEGKLFKCIFREDKAEGEGEQKII
ncbi:M61 family peptidase [Sulfolobus sp. S-194]|uniref:M61 family metallopeptidase n=1 Tax=Sulfolobus sp. S-194 TaxID=2512240 RepID=UPI0014373DA8|nr:M61 family metallopeptidase [Sulfolobus sp. S-194]QIW23507.1 M61 family peptidase [Sulfolobus sp. S-194]